MGTKRSEAFVLRTVPVGEADRIVTLLTRSSGKVRAVARNAWRSRRRFGGGLEILTRVQAEWYERDGAALGRLEHCELRTSSFDLLQESLEASFLMHYLAELADAFAREQDPDPRSYRLLTGCLEAVRAGAAPGCVARYFELWSLRLHGVLTGWERCAACGRSMASGPVHLPAPGSEPVCGRCRPAERGTVALTGADGDWMRRLWRTGPTELCTGVPPPGAAVTRFARREIETYLERPLRSRRFLQEALADRPRRPTDAAGTGTV